MELLVDHYMAHVLRRPLEEWPEPVNRSFGHLNRSIYVPMQGPSELGASGLARELGSLAELQKDIHVPTLVIGGKYDTMDPAHMEKMSHELPKGRFLLCHNGSHMAMYDDQDIYTSASSTSSTTSIKAACSRRLLGSPVRFREPTMASGLHYRRA